MIRLIQILAWCVLVLVLFSCDDPDTELPTIEITVTKNGAIQDLSNAIYGDLVIEVNASDNGNIKVIKLVYESAVIAEAANSSLTFPWDSRTVEDGSHTMTVYVEDAAGNSNEKDLILNISNYLMSFSTVDFVAQTSKYYVFLSDHGGNLLESKLLEDRKEKVIFNRPKTETDTYQLHVVSTFNNYYWISSYMNVPPDDYFVKSLFTNQPTSAGTHTVIVPDRNSYGNFSIESENGISFLPVNNFTQYDVLLSSATSNLFIGFGSSMYPNPLYYFDSEISVGETTTMDINLIAQFVPMSSQEIDLTTEQSSIAFATVFGNIQNRSTLISFTTMDYQYKLKLFYPPIPFFNDYISEVYYGSMANSYNVFHHLVQKGTLPVNTKDIVTAQLNSLESYTTTNLTFWASGVADFFDASFTSSTSSTTVEWHVYGPMQAFTDIKLPAFPEQFLIDHNLQFIKDKKFTGIAFSDIPTINTYNEFVNQQLKKDNTGKNSSIPDLIRSVIFQTPN